MEPINETTARQLLARYHQGETSLVEERQLSQYFCNAQLPHDLIPYRSLFRFFQNEAAVMPHKTSSTPLETIPIKATRYHRNVVLRRWIPIAAAASITAVAATLLLFFHLFGPAKNDFVCYINGERIFDQEEALQLAQQQWVQISERIAQATDMVNKLEQMTTYTKTINKYIP